MEQSSANNQNDQQILNQNLDQICQDLSYNTKKLFISNQGNKVPDFFESTKVRLLSKINQEYKIVQNNLDENVNQITDNIETLQAQQTAQEYQEQKQQQLMAIQAKQEEQQLQKSRFEKIMDELPQEKQEKLSKIPLQFLNFQKQTQEFDKLQSNLLLTQGSQQNQNNFQLSQDSQQTVRQQNYALVDKTRMGSAIANKISKVIKPEWHRPWKLMRVIAGHKGWVRSIAVDPGNQFFVTGSTDRTIKFWDLASGQLKLTITGHISPIRALVLSHRHPYLFSCSEDKTIRCWDLEMNQCIRVYTGHLSGIYCLSMHPTLDILASGGRDSCVRLWDIRMRSQIHILGGHEHTVNSVIMQEFEPQLISGSQDSTIRIWDIAAGKSLSVLTNHKKSIRSMLFHHKEYTFASGAPDNIKVWKCPEAQFLRNISGNTQIINTLSLNTDNVLVSGSDSGVLKFWDWKSGYNFQTIQQKPQPGSISAENGIYCSAFDQSSMRLFTGECDKTIKVYKEDEKATPESHPITDFKIEYNSQI